MRGNDSDEQAVFGDLDLINQHPFRQREQRRPFHFNLTFGDETIFERVLIKGTLSLFTNILQASRQ
jgi:hypothetical protein